MVKPLIIRNKDIAVIFDCTPSTACKKMRVLKDALNKKRHQTVSLTEFCKYFDLQVNEVIEKINMR